MPNSPNITIHPLLLKIEDRIDRENVFAFAPCPFHCSELKGICWLPLFQTEMTFLYLMLTIDWRSLVESSRHFKRNLACQDVVKCPLFSGGFQQNSPLSLYLTINNTERSLSKYKSITIQITDILPSPHPYLFTVHWKHSKAGVSCIKWYGARLVARHGRPAPFHPSELCFSFQNFPLGQLE